MLGEDLPHASLLDSGITRDPYPDLVGMHIISLCLCCQAAFSLCLHVTFLLCKSVSVSLFLFLQGHQLLWIRVCPKNLTLTCYI